MTTTWITLTEAARWVTQHEGVPRTRQTLHNWTSRGRGSPPTRLKTKTRAGQLFTTEEWLTDFLKEIA